MIFEEMQAVSACKKYRRRHQGGSDGAQIFDLSPRFDAADTGADREHRQADKFGTRPQNDLKESNHALMMQ